MSQTLYYSGVVTGDGVKSYELPHIPAHRLDRVQEKYANMGAILTIRGLSTLPPNPDPEPRPVRNGSYDEGIKRGPIEKTTVATIGAKSKTDNRGGRRLSMMRSVICITTQKFFPCVTDAALAYGLQIPSVSAHVNHPRKHRQVKGYQFRFATDDERAVKSMLHP